MTNLEILYSVQHMAQILSKEGNIEMSLEQFNNLLKIAQDELFKEFADGYITGNGVEVDSKTTKALDPFFYSQLVPSTTTTSYGGYGVNASFATLDASCYKVLSAHAYVIGSGNNWDNAVPVDIITHAELLERLFNPITKSTTTHPVAIIKGSELHFLIYGALAVRILMLKKPTTPSLVITQTNYARTQDSSSVALQFDSIFHVDIIRKILKYLGVIVGNEFISTMVEQQKTNEK